MVKLPSAIAHQAPLAALASLFVFALLPSWPCAVEIPPEAFHAEELDLAKRPHGTDLWCTE
jgi:hypothetical protein